MLVGVDANNGETPIVFITEVMGMCHGQRLTMVIGLLVFVNGFKVCGHLSLLIELWMHHEAISQDRIIMQQVLMYV